MESKVIIKQIANPDNPKLSVKYVGAKEYATPKLGKDEKIITGFDENAYSIIILEDGESKKKSNEVKKEREALEKALNVDLKPNSDFWKNFYIVLDDEERNLDLANPRDRLHERFLVANRYVAPSLEDITSNPEYYNCLFYIHREKEETTKKAQDQRKLDKAISQLFILFEENPLKLQQVAGDIFGYDPQEVSADESYVKLKEFLDSSDNKSQKDNIIRFLETIKKSPEEMGVKKIFDKALKKRFVTSKGNIFRRGDLVYGNNYEEALDYLGSPENSSELLSLKKEVDRL